MSWGLLVLFGNGPLCPAVILLLLFPGSCPAWEQMPQESGTGWPLALCSAQGATGASKWKCFQDYRKARKESRVCLEQESSL